MPHQLCQHVAMVRPASFGFNSETAVSNDYQKPSSLSGEALAKKAQEEFDNTVSILQQAGIDVTVIDDMPTPPKPDAVFPNNWVQFGHDGWVHLFPMATPNRAAERRLDILASLGERFSIKGINNLSHYEQYRQALEGTGSIVYHHPSKTAYACLSPRTDAALLQSFCKQIGYQPYVFHSHRQNGTPQYHTNVVMCIGEGFAVVGLDSVDKPQALEESLTSRGLTVVPLSNEQLENSFAGNMLQVKNKEGKPITVLSQRAADSLSSAQRQTLEGFGQLLPVPLHHIEEVGGGSARCMIAEIFLPLR